MIFNIPDFMVYIAKDWIDVFAAWLTPVIALITVYIAYQQWRTAEAQRRKDLFEMRYDKLYKEIIDIHTKMMVLDLSKVDDKSEFLKLRIKSWETYEEYGFTIKKKDAEILKTIIDKWRNIITNFNNNINNTKESVLYAYKNDQLKCIEEIKDLLEQYLRIEQEDKNIWELIPLAIVRLLYFILPKTIIRSLNKKI